MRMHLRSCVFNVLWTQRQDIKQGISVTEGNTIYICWGGYYTLFKPAVTPLCNNLPKHFQEVK